MKKYIVLCLFVAVAGLMTQSFIANAAETKTPAQYLADLSPDKDEQTIVTAADWAGSKKEKKAVSKLIALMSDTRVNVRIQSAVALGLIGDDKAADTLNNALLNDQSPDVRYAAVLAITRIGSPKSLSAIKEAKGKETDPFVKDYLVKMEERLLKK